MKKKLTKLSNRSILSVSGKDSEQFLQGIVTCDIKNIKKRSSYGSILTPQGKLLYELGTREILDSNNEFFNSDQDSYEKQKIKLGIAEVGSEIKSGELFPMEANLDYLKGIDFKKGCFIGQEVTSRMYRKGKVKKRIIAFESKDTFTSNEELVYNNQTIGAVIKKIDDYGLALVKIEKIINPEREKIKITTKNNDKNVIFIFPDFLSE